jgi:hypothetical protein
MNAPDPDKKIEKVKTARMQDLILRIERGREGVNTCRFKDECARSTQCPGAC